MDVSITQSVVGCKDVLNDCGDIVGIDTDGSKVVTELKIDLGNNSVTLNEDEMLILHQLTTKFYKCVDNPAK